MVLGRSSATLLKLVDNPQSTPCLLLTILESYLGQSFLESLWEKPKNSKELLKKLSLTCSKIVEWIINLAPFGITLVLFLKPFLTRESEALPTTVFLVPLVKRMFLVAPMWSTLIAFFFMSVWRDPYTLVWKTASMSGVTAFFTRSSATNIPVNIWNSDDLGNSTDTYSVSIPLGSTIKIWLEKRLPLTLRPVTVNTLGIPVDFATALLLSVWSAISACGASGVLTEVPSLIPVACSLFGIFLDIAIQVELGLVLWLVSSKTHVKQPLTLLQMSSLPPLPNTQQPVKNNSSRQAYSCLVLRFYSNLLGEILMSISQRTTKLISSTCLACLLAYFLNLSSGFGWNNRSLEPIWYA